MFHCLVIKVCCVCLSDSSFILSHLKSFVKYFFQLFSNSFLMNFCLADSLFTLSHPQAFVNKFFHFFEKFILLRSCCRFVDDLDTLSYLLSFVNCEFHFSEILFNCLFFRNNYLRQLSYNTTGSYACQP